LRCALGDPLIKVSDEVMKRLHEVKMLGGHKSYDSAIRQIISERDSAVREAALLNVIVTADMRGSLK